MEGTGTSYFYNTSGCNVGIGTTSPGQILAIKATHPIMECVNASNATKGYLGVQGTAKGVISGCDANELVIRSENEKINFSTNSGTSACVTMSTGGSVGIGTTAPGAKLEVSGDAKVSGDLLD